MLHISEFTLTRKKFLTKKKQKSKHNKNIKKETGIPVDQTIVLDDMTNN